MEILEGGTIPVDISSVLSGFILVNSSLYKKSFSFCQFVTATFLGL